MSKKDKNDTAELTAEERIFFNRLESAAKSEHQVWFENADFLPNGSMYHTSGEDGIYIRIRKDGAVDAGIYTDALPDINNADFKPIIEGNFPNHHTAVNNIIGFVGMRFYTDTMTEASRRIRQHIEAEQIHSDDTDIDITDYETNYDEQDYDNDEDLEP